MNSVLARATRPVSRGKALPNTIQKSLSLSLRAFSVKSQLPQRIEPPGVNNSSPPGNPAEVTRTRKRWADGDEVAVMRGSDWAREDEQAAAVVESLCGCRWNIFLPRGGHAVADEGELLQF